MFFVLLLVVTLLLVYLLNSLKRPPNFPPGPQWLPFVGNQLQLRKLRKSLKGLHLALSSWADKYKSNIVGLKLGNELVVVVYDYSLIRDVLIRDEFEGRPDNFFFKMRTFGRRKSGITGSDGIVWSTNRNFVMRHLRSLGFGKQPMETMIKDEAHDIVDFLALRGSSIDIGKLFAARVLNVLWRLTCGKRISDNYQFLDDILNLFNMRGKVFDITGGLLNMYPWLRFILPNWTGYSLIQEINHKLKTIVDEKVREHLDSWQEGKDDDLMYCYISEIKRAEPGSVFCYEELVVVVFDFFIAGAQTTSGTLELLFSMMILYPEIQKKVHDEIDDKIGSNVLSYSDLNKLPYVHAVLMETQRCLPVLPIIGPRRANSDTTLGGYFIPQDTTVLLSLHGMYHDEAHWPNPNKFDPERFLDKDGSLITPENYLPFGLGKRRCLGEILAKQALFFFFVETMRNFKVSLTPGSKKMSGNLSVGITLLTEEYKAEFTKR